MLEVSSEPEPELLQEVEYKSGVRFEGQLKETLRTGTGNLYWPDGSKYEGEFVENKRHGRGVFHYTDGSVYEGLFNSDMRHGDGELRHSNSEVKLHSIVDCFHMLS